MGNANSGKGNKQGESIKGKCHACGTHLDETAIELYAHLRQREEFQRQREEKKPKIVRVGSCSSIFCIIMCLMTSFYLENCLDQMRVGWGCEMWWVRWSPIRCFMHVKALICPISARFICWAIAPYKIKG